MSPFASLLLLMPVAAPELPEVGGDFRISETSSIGREPNGAYDPTRDRYLIVYSFVPLSGGGGGFAAAAGGGGGAPPEIAGRFLDAESGELLGAGSTQYSQMGSPELFGFGVDPEVVYNENADEFLIVWAGRGEVAPDVTDSEIFAQRVDAATGLELGTDFAVSDMGSVAGGSGGASYPSVAYNPDDDEYFVVWFGSDDENGNTLEAYEIFGQRLRGSDGVEQGTNDMRLSTMGADDTDTDFGVERPRVYYNAVAGEYAVVFTGADNVLDGMSMFLQRVDATTGAEIGTDDLRVGGSRSTISSIAGDKDGNYVVVTADYVPGHPADIEVFATFLSGGTTPTATIQVSDMGVEGAADWGGEGQISYDPDRDEFLVLWSGENGAPELAETENEIFGQWIDAATFTEVGLDDFRVSEIGPDGDESFEAHSSSLVFDSNRRRFLALVMGDDATTGHAVFGQVLQSRGSLQVFRPVPNGPNIFVPGFGKPAIGQTWATVLGGGGAPDGSSSGGSLQEAQSRLPRPADTTEFASILLIATEPGFQSLGDAGTLLLDPATIIDARADAFGWFYVAIPNDANLIGTTLATQAAMPFLPSNRFTNALDITIGAY